MDCVKYKCGIIRKVKVKVTKRDMQRFPESLGIKIYSYKSIDTQMNTHVWNSHRSKEHSLQTEAKQKSDATLK